MTYVVKTLGDCKQSLADRMTNGIVPTDAATLTYWTRLLNNGVLYCADKIRINNSTPLTTVNGTIALPADFIVIGGVFDSDNNEQTRVDSADLPNHIGPVFWITGDQFNGFFLNTPNDATWTVEYAYRPTPMVTDADKCVIPDIEAPVAFAYGMKRKSESDPFQDADKAIQECDSRLKEMQSQYAVNNDSIGFSWT